MVVAGIPVAIVAVVVVSVSGMVEGMDGILAFVVGGVTALIVIAGDFLVVVGVSVVVFL